MHVLRVLGNGHFHQGISKVLENWLHDASHPLEDLHVSFITL